MKAIVFICLLFILPFTVLFANLVKNQPFEQIQPDGTKLSLLIQATNITTVYMMQITTQ